MPSSKHVILSCLTPTTTGWGRITGPSRLFACACPVTLQTLLSVGSCSVWQSLRDDAMNMRDTLTELLKKWGHVEPKLLKPDSEGADTGQPNSSGSFTKASCTPGSAPLQRQWNGRKCGATRMPCSPNVPHVREALPPPCLASDVLRNKWVVGGWVSGWVGGPSFSCASSLLRRPVA